MKLTIDFNPDSIAREQVLLVATDFAGYQHVLRQLDDAGRKYRSTFDDGLLEIIVPGNIHEAVKKTIAQILETYRLAIDVQIEGMGSTTLDCELKQKGLEPDECYFINRSPLPGRDRFDDIHKIDSPDLAIEVDVSSRSLPREPVYAALGVREIWRWKDGAITVRELFEGSYRTVPRSIVLPDLDLAAFTKHVDMALTPGNQTAATRAWFEWLKANPIG